jgi:hypothetical protein
MTGQAQTYRPGSMSRLIRAGVLLTAATLLGAWALYWEVTPVTRDGEAVKYMVTPVMFLVAIVLAWWGSAKLAAVERRQLTTKMVFMSLALGLVPYSLLLGVPGYVFNLGFLLAAVNSALAARRFANE